MRQIEKRVVDDPMNNISTRKMAIKQVKKMRNGSRSMNEKRSLDKLIDRLEAEIQAIIDKQNGVSDKEESTPKKTNEKTPEEVKAILDRLNKIQEQFKY